MKWKLVPVEPTQEMLDAGVVSRNHAVSWPGIANFTYSAMLEAAPNPPAVQETWPLELCAKTVATLTYIRGIAERGEGRPMRDDETLDQFLLGYVRRLEAPAVGSHTQEQAVQTDHPEHHLEMVKQELFQAQQALLNEGQQRDKLLAALEKIDAAAKESTTIIGFSSKAFRMLGEIRALIAEAKGDK